MQDKRLFLRGYIEAERRIALKRAQAKQFGHAEQIEAEVDALEKQRAEVLAAINSVPDPVLRTLLEARFVTGLRWKDVSRLIGYSEKQTFNLYNRALEQIKI